MHRASAKIKEKKARNPAYSKPRTSQQKNDYAQKCAKAGNLSKANKVICQELLHACGSDTVEKLRLLHPDGDLTFEREFWPSPEASRAHWRSEQGQSFLQEHLSVAKIRNYFRRWPALGAPDIDGWRGREHLAFMFLNDDHDFHARVRHHLILPYLYNSFIPQYAAERAGGHLFAFIKPTGGLRPLVCGSIFRRCFASLVADGLKKPATTFFTTTYENFIQCAGGLPDGATYCAHMVQAFDSEPPDTYNDSIPAMLNIDIRNAFNSSSRHAAFDAIVGRASREYDGGNVKKGDELPALPGLAQFFEYFRAMHDTEGKLRYVDPHGQVHIIRGTTGGQQGDPLEMMRFCATIHPIWGRVMAKYRSSRALAFADDGFVRADLKTSLHILVDLKRAFLQDANLDLQLHKCKIYLTGMMLEDARALVKDMIEDTPELHSLRPLLTLQEDPNRDVVQVDGMVCAGVPMGSPDFVRTFVHEKTKAMIQDVCSLHIMQDPLIHLQLVRFCHNTKLSYLSRALPPHILSDPACGVQTADRAMAMEILRRGTGGRCDSWPQAELAWHLTTIQLPHHLGGLGLTPQQASGIAAFYSAAARFVAWLPTLPHATHWLRAPHDLAAPSTWTAQNLIALRDTHARLVQEYKCVEGAPPATDAPLTSDSDSPAPTTSLPPLNLLCRQHNLSEEETGAGYELLPPEARHSSNHASLGPTSHRRTLTACWAFAQTALHASTTGPLSYGSRRCWPLGFTS